MSTATATRPRPAAAAPAATGRRARLRTALVCVVAAGVVAGGTWGLLSPREAADAGHGGQGAAAVGTVALPDGTLRVDGLVDKQVGSVMPDMEMAKDVPVGMRRFAVNISLGATGEGPLAYTLRDFTVFGPGVKPVAPVDAQLLGTTLLPGATASGSLSFDVPKETTALSLRFRDAEAVPLPALPALAEGGGQMEAPAEAPGAPPAQAPGHASAEDPGAAGGSGTDAH